MAEIEELAYPQLFVTRRCCGAFNCRNFAPTLLAEVPPADDSTVSYSLLPGSFEHGAFTGVVKQPATPEEYYAAKAAVRACAFNAIELRGQRIEVPAPLTSAFHPRELQDGVFLMGAADVSDKTFGAMSYLIARPEGNILVDLPRPSEALFEFLDKKGGLEWLFISHKDHAAGHQAVAARMGCKRIIGAADVCLKETEHMAYTGDVEVTIQEQSGIFSLDGEAMSCIGDADLAILPTPGHTPGGLCLVYKRTFFFTGDHIAHSHAKNRMTAHRIECWQDWATLRKSTETLLQRMQAGDLCFHWILPGHGEINHYESPASATKAMENCIEWMNTIPAGNQPLFPGFVLWTLARHNPRSLLARFLNFIGGRAKESWILTTGSRKLLPDHDAAAVADAFRRLYGLMATGPLLLGLGCICLLKRSLLHTGRGG